MTQPERSAITNSEFLGIALGIHTRSVIVFLDAVERADTPVQRAELLAMIRGAVLEFENITQPLLLDVTP